MAKRRRRVRPENAEAPTVSCLLICDDVLISVNSQKQVLNGVVDRIHLADVPGSVGPFVAYVRLSNVYAFQKVQLRFCHADSDEAVFSFNAKAPVQSNPLGTHTLILKIPAFVISEPGRYALQAIHNGVPFAETRILIESSIEGDKP